MSESGTGAPRLQPLGEDDPVQVGRYRLRARIGSGGMGRVYLAYTPGGRAVAVKVVRQELAEDDNFRRRFRQEVRAAALVDGLFTAPVLDSDTEAPRPWLVTSYVPGLSLADAVARYGALPVDSVLLLVAGIAEALESVHRAGIVHRDLKPSNVLLAADGPRLIDFGIARAAEATVLTVSGHVVGTPSYMSPEQATGGRDVGPASDIFTLGQIAAFAATGSSAFGEGNVQALLYRVVHEPPRIDALPEPLRGLVAHCLVKDPADRPSLAEIMAACRAAVDARALRRPDQWLPPTLASALPHTPPHAPPRTPSSGPGAPSDSAAPPDSPDALNDLRLEAPEARYGAAGSNSASGQASSASAGRERPGAAVSPGTAAAAAPGRAARHRRTLLAVAVCAVLALVAGAGYALLPGTGDKTDGRHGAEQPQPQPHPRPDTSTDADPTEPTESAEPTEPAPDVQGTVRLPEGWHINLDADPLKPDRSGTWNKDRIDFRYHRGRLRTRDGNRLALLSAHREGSLTICHKQVGFTQNIELKGIGAGRQVCLFTQDGHAALVTLRDPAPADRATFTITVWRDAAKSP